MTAIYTLSYGLCTTVDLLFMIARQPRPAQRRFRQLRKGDEVAGSGALVPRGRQGNPAISGQRLSPRRSGVSDKALLQTLQKDVLGQVDPDEDHLAVAGLALGPLRPEIASHQLVHAL